MSIPLNFQPTAAAYSLQQDGNRPGRMPQSAVRNPQTVALFDLLGLDYNLDHRGTGSGHPSAAAGAGAVEAVENPEEIDIDDVEDDDTMVEEDIVNPEEIELGDDDEEDEEGAGVDPALAAILGR